MLRFICSILSLYCYVKIFYVISHEIDDEEDEDDNYDEIVTETRLESSEAVQNDQFNDSEDEYR